MDSNQPTNSQWPVVYFEDEGRQIPIEIRGPSSPEEYERLLDSIADFLVAIVLKQNQINAEAIRSETPSIQPKPKRKKTL